MPERKNNPFVRGLLVVFILFLAYLVIKSFHAHDKPFELGAGIISVLLLITVLILSEAFDNLSLGKLLTLSRELQKKEETIKETKQENAALRDNLMRISVSLNQAQQQSNLTFNGMPLTPELLRMLGVVRVEDKSREERLDGTGEANHEKLSEAKEFAVKTESIQLDNKLLALMEEEAVERYRAAHRLPQGELTRKVQFSQAFQGLDPIMERRIVFDAHMKSSHKEYFFEIIFGGKVSPGRYDRLYVMLAKILNYRQAKKIDAELILLLMQGPEGEPTDSPKGQKNTNSLLTVFQPAIANQLFQIETINYTREDINRWESLLNRS